MSSSVDKSSHKPKVHKSEHKPEHKAEHKPAEKPAHKPADATSKSPASKAWGGKSDFDAKPSSSKLVSSPAAANTVKGPTQPGAQPPGAPKQALAGADAIAQMKARPLSEGSSQLEITLAKPGAGAGESTAPTVTNMEATQVGGATATSAVIPVVERNSCDTTPPIPSYDGTVQVTGNSLSETEKLARGALKLDPGADPKTYDGMYIGSDGFAYPPDKFKATEVPPFSPKHPLSDPPQTTYFVNGIQTDHMQVVSDSQELANRTGTNVVPIYNATEGGGWDIAQTGLDRRGVGSNPAANTLADVMAEDLAAGRNVNVVGYSQGGAIVSHALQTLEDRHVQPLSNINMVGIASAGNEFPAGPKYTFYVNTYDVVPNTLGVHPYNPVFDSVVPPLVATSPLLLQANGNQIGASAPGATVYTISDSANILMDPISPHYLGTYFGHIPER